MVNDQTLFPIQSGGDEPDHPNLPEEKQVRASAHRLAIRFMIDTGQAIPARYKIPAESRSKLRKVKKKANVGKESKTDKDYKKKLESWIKLINNMLTKIDNPQAWRFIYLAPEIGPTVNTLTDCEDFRSLIDYLIMRRDRETCCDEELGELAWLSGAFQRKIEKRLKRKPQP